MLNGKKYIGITCQKPQQRWRYGKGYKSSPHFYSAIQKYGWDSFTHEILYENLSEQDAKMKEIYLIEKYKTRDKNFGYNVTPGGELCSGEDSPTYGTHLTEAHKMAVSNAHKGIPLSDEHKKRISEALKGRIFSPETLKKMSENHADVSGDKNPMYGKKQDPEHMALMVKLSKTPEAIEKMKKNRVWYSGKDNPNAKSVICLDTMKVYETVNDAAKDNGCNASKVSAVCHGDRKSTNNLHFKLLEDYENAQLVC